MILALLLVALTSWHLTTLRAYALNDARRDVENLRITLEQQVARSVESVDVALEGLSQRLRLDGQATPSIARISSAAAEVLGQLPQVSELVVVDRDGKRLVDTRSETSISDESLRTAIRAHSDEGRDALIVSPPNSKDQPSHTLLLLSRPAPQADGGLGGVVMAALSPKFFQDFYLKLDLGEAGAVTLVSRSGVLILRRPFLATKVWMDLRGTDLFQHVSDRPSDTYFNNSPIDQIYRLVSYETIPSYGLIVVSSVSTAEYLAIWWKQLGIEVFASIVALAIVSYLSYRNARLERRRRESAQLHELLANNVGDIVILKSANQKYHYVSSASLRILGYAPEEMMRLDSRGLIHPDDLGPALAAQARLSSENPVVVHSHRNFRKDGRCIWVEVVYRLFDPGSYRADHHSTILTVRDITARVEAEGAASRSAARAKLTLEATSDIVFAVDRSWRVTYVNSNARWHQRHALSSQPATLWEAEPDLLGTEFEACYRKVMANREPAGVTARFRNNRWFSARATPSADDDDGIVVFVTDVTAKKELEDLLVQEREGAMALARAKSEFLANMSHELRTPLNAVIGFAEMIEASTSTPDAGERNREYATDIRQSGEHLLGLINEILDFSKAEAGKLLLHCDRLSPATLIENCVRMIRPRADRMSVSISTAVDACPEDFIADEKRVKQILLNLLANAIKFTPSGGRVEIRGWWAHGLVVTVRDTGIGIPEKELDRVMEAFTQVDNSSTRAQEGTGLGLPLSRRLAELHGGSLRIESSVGNGTTVTLVLPDQTEPAEAVIDRGPAVRSLPLILVVDDDALVRRDAADSLRQNGFRVLEADGGNEALACLQRGEPVDVMVTDIVMPPGLDGLALARKISQLRPGIRILLASSYATHLVVHDDDFREFSVLTKPYRSEELVQRVESLLASSNAETGRVRAG